MENLCPVMSRPYLYRYMCNGNLIEETRMHEVECYEKDCAKYNECVGRCGLCKK
jgi:hypothetical protein